MGLLDSIFGRKDKVENQPDTTPIPSRSDRLSDLMTETIKHGGQSLGRVYWNSIYLGAYAPTIDMAIFKGKAISKADAEQMVRHLTDVLGPDLFAEEIWSEEDALNVEMDHLSRNWRFDDININLEIDNHHSTDDPVMLSINPMVLFRPFMVDKMRT